MSLIINGTTIPSSGNVTFDGHNVEKIICDGITVWEKMVDFYVYNTGTFSGGPTNINLCKGYPRVRGVHRTWDGSSYTFRNTGSSFVIEIVANHKCSLLTNTKVDLTAWKYITVNAGIRTDYVEEYGAWITQDTVGHDLSVDGDTYTNIVTENVKTFPINTKIDISSITGSYYLGVYIANGITIGTVNRMELTRIILSMV